MSERKPYINGSLGNKILVGIFIAMIGAGVTGVWKMSTAVERWSAVLEDMQDRVKELERIHRTGQHEGADRRLRTLENLHRPDSPHTQH